MKETSPSPRFSKTSFEFEDSVVGSLVGGATGTGIADDTSALNPRPKAILVGFLRPFATSIINYL